VSHIEEKVYRVGKAKPNLSDLKSQLLRLKADLTLFASRQSGDTVTAALKTRIRELETIIAAAEDGRRRAQAARADAADDQTVRSTTGRYPSRRRPV